MTLIPPPALATGASAAKAVRLARARAVQDIRE